MGAFKIDHTSSISISSSLSAARMKEWVSQLPDDAVITSSTIPGDRNEMDSRVLTARWSS